MLSGFGLGIGILLAGLALLLCGFVCHLMAKDALRQRPIHDGIGGKDTDNVMVGCFGAIIGPFFLCAGGVFSLIGLVILAFSR